MATTLVPTSELDAVNAMLSIIGEPLVNSLVAPVRQDVTNAINALNTACRLIQVRGWYWNREVEVQLSNAGAPDYFIPFAPNVISARISGRSLNTDTAKYIYRNGRLYNRSTRSYNFQAVSSIYVDQTVLVLFDELPEAARLAIFRRAAIDFQEGSLKSLSSGAVTEQMAVEAWSALLQDEIDVMRYQITSGPGQFELNYRR